MLTALRHLVPGGFLFTHAIFWTVVGMVAVGTITVSAVLSMGFVILVLESLGKA